MSPRTPWGTYHQIAASLKTRIDSGEFAPGDVLPSESALSAEFGVSRTTVRRALAALEKERLIRALQGTGRIVCSVEEREGPDDGRPPVQYRRIAAELREEITSGRLGPGDPLPSEAAIVDRYGVSRGTARQALSELEGTGLISVVRGKGRFVKGGETATG
ncbi:GntR family transcriptional regulator [Nocardiopsis sp. LOL_012]|uniref:GntR family transcriptional regulator n=1 Tax=Nocardiopsis sp. LOL_012 TaxID=3345409 RepID=UPI003A87B2DD